MQYHITCCGQEQCYSRQITRGYTLQAENICQRVYITTLRKKRFVTGNSLKKKSRGYPPYTTLYSPLHPWMEMFWKTKSYGKLGFLHNQTTHCRSSLQGLPPYIVWCSEFVQVNFVLFLRKFLPLNSQISRVLTFIISEFLALGYLKNNVQSRNKMCFR